MKIYKLNSEEWQIYKNLRLEALRQVPAAFGASYEESVGRTDHEWREKLENPKSYIFVARDGDDYIGMAAAYQEQGEKMAHIGYVWGVYVRDAYRGQKMGKHLMQAVLDELKNNEEIEKVNLNVNVAQLAAVKLYESLGFQIAGTLHKEMKIGNEYVDEYVMEKIFIK